MLHTFSETDYRPRVRRIYDYSYMYIYLPTGDSDDFFTNIIYL